MASIHCESQERSVIDFLKRIYLVLHRSIRVWCIGGGRPSGASYAKTNQRRKNIKALMTLQNHLMVRQEHSRCYLRHPARISCATLYVVWPYTSPSLFFFIYSLIQIGSRTKLLSQLPHALCRYLWGKEISNESQLLNALSMISIEGVIKTKFPSGGPLMKCNIMFTYHYEWMNDVNIHRHSVQTSVQYDVFNQLCSSWYWYTDSHNVVLLNIIALQ